MSVFMFFSFFFFNDTATTEIYTLSLHDALPIYAAWAPAVMPRWWKRACMPIDRKSTRLNSSHGSISYAVFCLKKKKKISFNGGRKEIIEEAPQGRVDLL